MLGGAKVATCHLLRALKAEAEHVTEDDDESEEHLRLSRATSEEESKVHEV